MTPAMVGLAYRPALASWIESCPPQCLEVAAEPFYKAGERQLRSLAALCPLVVHSTRLSLGTPGPIDADELVRLGRVVEAADPLWVSDHLGFSRTGEVDLGWPSPVVAVPESLPVLADHVREVQDRLRRRLLVENVVHFLASSLHAEPGLLNVLCRDTGCGILLDLTALVVNARNHGVQPQAWLRDLDLAHVVQLHVGGCALEDERWHDSHRDPVPDDVLELAAEVLRAAPVRAVVLERDGRWPPPAALEAELARLEALAAGAASAGTASPAAAGAASAAGPTRRLPGDRA